MTSIFFALLLYPVCLLVIDEMEDKDAAWPSLLGAGLLISGNGCQGGSVDLAREERLVYEPVTVPVPLPVFEPV